jgi:hypothetical protein
VKIFLIFLFSEKLLKKKYEYSILANNDTDTAINQIIKEK